jgi:hypothetical protein
MEKELRKRCVECFEKNLETELAIAVEKKLAQIPKTRDVVFGFTPVLDELKAGVYVSPRDWINRLTARVTFASDILGVSSPTARCMFSVMTDILRDADPLVNNDDSAMKKHFHEFMLKFSNELESVPNSLKEFQDLATRKNCRKEVENAPNSEFDESLVPTDDLMLLSKRLEKAPTDDILAGIVDIIQRYEPETEPPGSDDELKVDLTKFSAATVQKLNDYMDKHVKSEEEEESESGDN